MAGPGLWRVSPHGPATAIHDEGRWHRSRPDERRTWISRPALGRQVPFGYNAPRLKLGAETGMVSTSPCFPACPGLCGFLCGFQLPEALLVHWVVSEPLTPPGEQHFLVDDADALPVACVPSHGHAALTPVADRAGGASDSGGGLPVGEKGHGQGSSVIAATMPVSSSGSVT